jgi:hypothetical protein
MSAKRGKKKINPERTVRKVGRPGNRPDLEVPYKSKAKRAPKKKNVIIDLRPPNLADVEVNTKVITSKGYSFTLTKKDNAGNQYWHDNTSGLIWGPVEQGKFSHHEATAKFGNMLPTKEEFEEAEKHGFREVIPRIKDFWLWSSSVYPYYTDGACVFVGSYGGIVNYYRSYAYGAAVCVAAR